LTSQREQRAYWAWIAVCISWGTTYLATRIGLESFPPFVMAGTRHVIAGGILAAFVTARGIELPPRSSWGAHALLGTLMIGLGNGPLVWAQQFVPSGVAAVMVSMIPFWMVGVEALMPNGERLRLPQLAGLILGFGGIVLLTRSNLQTDGSSGRQVVLGVAAIQCSCLGWSIGSAYAKRHKRHENVIAATSLQIIFGGAVLMLLASLTGEWSDVRFTVRSSLAVAYLLVFGSFVGYVCYVYALKYLPISIVSLYAFVNPVIAVILGALLLNEPFTGRMAFATAIIFVAMVIVRSSAGAEHPELVGPEQAGDDSERGRAVEPRRNAGTSRN
jgi:drug/metabolite transporter (DMT)-like permease